MKANLSTSLIAYARGGVRKQLLVLCLLTLCAGNMWGGTRRIYFDYSDVSMWDDAGAHMCVHCWGGNVSGKDYDMLAVEGQTALVYADIDEGHTNLCFFRQNPNNNDWWNQTQDWREIRAYNRFKIKNEQGTYGDDNGKYLWADSDAAIRWTPNVAIDGLLDPLNPHNQAFDNNGEYTVTLAARTTYEFKILNGSALYGLDNHVWTSSVSKYTLYENQYQIRLCTAGEGEYKFTWDNTNKKLSVTYPTVSHPSIDYCYVIDYKWNPRAILHVWNCTSELVGVWNDEQTIAGTTYPGPPLYNTTNIGGQDYFYIALGDYQDFIVAKNSDGTSDKTGDVKTTDGYGKLRSWASEDGWQWRAFTVRIQLENLDATTAGTEYLDVGFNDAVLENIECPQKDHYDFGGYWTEQNGSGLQLIDATGAWIASVEGYTDAEKRWIHEGTSTTLYAKWTEHPYTINLVVSPKGAGTIDKGATIEAYYTTASDDITATASTGYSFGEWDFSKTGEDNDVSSADDYTSLSNPIRVLAQHDGTLTAKFTANNYNVNLENLDADEKGTENVSVTYNSSANLTENITSPQKEHYDFGGYYTSSDEGVTLDVQLIDENGAWIASVDGYTDSDKNWLYAGNLTLYAKWTEHPYTIDLVVYPEGAGTIKIGEEIVGSVNAFISTPTDLITATPANPAWKFKGWQYSENVGPADGTGNDNTVQIKATRNGTLTAVFESRYCLVGQLNDGSNEAGGMPGMNDYTVDFDFVSYTGLGEAGVELRCTRSLQPNKQYKFAIHDHVIGRNYGKNSGSDNPTLDAGESWELNTIDYDVLFNTSAAGEYTFKITHMTYGENGDYKCYYPTVEIVYPIAHQLELGWRYTLIDNHDELKVGDTGGTVTATSSGFSIKDKEYIADGEELQLTANANTGYRFDDKWYDNNDCQHSFMSGNPTHATVTSHFRVYAKFAEIPTPITITKIGGGEVQINGEDKESTSVGVTTTRTLTAVAAAGYTFIGWTLPDNADFEMIEGDVDNPTITLRGKGAGTAGEIIANFTECWVLSAESDGWGSAEFTIANITVEDGKAIGYADIALPANTNLQFKVVDKSTSSAYKNGVDQVYYMTYGNSQDWGFGTDKTYNCGITTAGRGSYRFNWNFTDKTMTVEYPESYQVNYGAAVGGSVTSVLDDDGKEIPNGGYVRKGGSVTYEATASDGYTFTGWCPDNSYGNTFTDFNPWKNENITATSNAYAKFHSTNFVIYRTGDKASDPRAVWDDVESYEGGIISETIEFRMKVNKLDFWYTLCLPFDVNAVQVWEEGAYYGIEPYYRTGDKYYTGHYIIRTPVSTTDFAIENFDSRDRWVDPSSAVGYLPSANTPYIIQWHDAYFQDKYISFFGTAGQEIPTDMDKVSYASSDETVNIYGNNSMTTVKVRDAYMLEPDYGPNGAWIREELGTDRSVLPFECFILANPATTAKYRVLRRDMADDTPTGLDTLSLTEDSVLKVMINNRIYIIRGGKIYTIQGTFVKEVE